MARDPSFPTRAIHAGQRPDPATGAVTTPIYQTSTFAQPALGEHQGFEYARVSNPTRSALEANVASLEGGERGFAFASGMAAISAVLSLVGRGDRVIVSRALYGGTHRLLGDELPRRGAELVFVDTTRPEAVAGAAAGGARLLWVETPSNPTMRISDLVAMAEVAHGAGALLAVDNTFMSPYLQRPLEHGADVVVHSTTKFLNGHSDSVGGVAVTSAPEIAERLAWVQRAVGAVLAPFEAFLVLRGIKTLAVRMERAAASAGRIAEHLAAHPAVSRVHYPGRPDHPGRAVHARQAASGGAVVSFDLGDEAAARRALERLRLVHLAESLGGVESLICHPASMAHAALSAGERSELGIGDGLLRLSVGLEGLDDLLEDLESALAGG